MDFAEMNNELLSNAEAVLHEWLPAGVRRGHEWIVGSLAGEPGESLSINMRTGVWADFAAPADRGGDLVSLYAAIHRVSQADALRALSNRRAPAAIARRVVKQSQTIIPPPPDAVEPLCQHYKLGAPSRVWRYLGRAGELLCMVARYETANGKEFRPWCWTDKGWRALAPESSRPLYGLQNLRPRRVVLVCEGEKSADAAQVIVQDQAACVSWMGGASAWAKADWSPLYGLDVTLWPDADEPGRKAAEGIAARLTANKCRVTVIDVDDMPPAWDAADFTGDYEALKAWMTPRIRKISAPPPPPAPPVRSTSGIEGWDTMHPAVRAETLKLDTNARGVPYGNLLNAGRVLSGSPDYRGQVWYDEFLDSVMTVGTDGKPRRWVDADDVRFQAYLQGTMGLATAPRKAAEDAVLLHAFENKRNACREFMDSLTWDQTPRLESLFEDAFGAARCQYASDVGRNWFVSMAARVYQPGCQVDTMVVLEGAQGARKSTALSIIASPWFVEAHESVLTKDFFEVLRGNLLAEIAEMHAFGRAEVERIKGVITCRQDKYRKAYGRHAEIHPRVCVLAGTTNRDDWHRDETGGRRFWPIRCCEIDLDYLRNNREQLWAEAVARFKAGETWHAIDVIEQRHQIDARQEYDAWEDIIAVYLEKQATVWHTAAEVMRAALDIPPSDQDRARTARVNRIFRLLGWEYTQMPSGGRGGCTRRARAWRRPE